MARKLMVSRYDWGQDPGASISGGSWETQLPPENMLNIQAQMVAQAIGSSVSFTLNLGAARNIGAVHLQRFVVDQLGTIDIPGFTAGPVNAWPSDANGLYDPLKFAALGRPRVFIPSSPVVTSAIDFNITGSTTPLQIGAIGACEMIELAASQEYGWKIVVIDESDIQRVPFGASYVTFRGKRRRLNMGVGFLREGGIYSDGGNDELSAPFDAALIAGRSFPILAAPEPDDIDHLERNSVWGLSTTDQEFANPFFATWATAYQVDQLI